MKFLRRLFLFIVVVLLIVFVAFPRFFEGKLGEILKEQVNQNIHATLEFDNVSLSLLKGFPYAHVTMRRPVLTNKFPFQGDTLFSAQQVSIRLSLGELFKGKSKPIGVRSLELDAPVLRMKVDLLGRANYDLERPGGASVDRVEPEKEESAGFRLDLKRYEIYGGHITYDDLKSGMHLEINGMNHHGFGDLSLESSELQTETEAIVSFEYDSISYLKDNKIALSAGFGLDLTRDRYVFLKNQALVNNLPLVFDGYVQLLEEGQEIDLRFETPSSDFKNFLAVIPERYARDIETVRTRGKFSVNGNLKGVVSGDRIPTFDVKVVAEDASFSYPDLDKSVRDVNIDSRFYNTTGKLEDTYVDLRNLSFDLDGDKFRSSAQLENLMGNAKVKAEVKGRLNLANLARAYPMPPDYDLQGLLEADVQADFDMKAVKDKEYEKTRTRGMLNLQNFKYNSDELRNPVEINTASISFDPGRVLLRNFDGKIGKTDMNVTGTIDNLLGFMFNKEEVVGDFKLESRNFVVNDFIMDEEVPVEGKKIPDEDTGYTVEKIRIPSFLDCNIDARAAQVYYDNMLLRKVSGKLRIKEQTATLTNLKGEVFGGNVAVNGEVSTAGAIPTFAMKLEAVSLNISDAFTSLNLFKALSPIGGSMQGDLTSSMEFSGLLKDNLTLELGAISGKVQSVLSQAKLDTKGTPMLLALDQEFDQISFDDWALDQTRVRLEFKDGAVAVEPFQVMLRDIPVKISGGHRFDQSLDYQLDFEIPTKYLGKAVTDLVLQLNDPGLLETRIPVRAQLKGNYVSPRLSTDLQFVAENLTKRLIEMQRDRAVKKGGDLIGDLLGGKKKDSTQKEDPLTNTAKSVLGNLLGGKQKDSTRN